MHDVCATYAHMHMCGRRDAHVGEGGGARAQMLQRWVTALAAGWRKGGAMYGHTCMRTSMHSGAGH